MDINDYFKQIAISHKEIAHTEEHPAYFREYSSSKILLGMSDFLNKMRYTKGTILISQFNKDGHYDGPNDDNIHKINTGTIYILKKVKSNEIDDAFNETHSIWEDIFAKIRKDEDEGNIEGLSFRLRFFYVHSIGMIADGFFGIAIFMDYYDLEDGTCKPYDENKWN